VVFTTNGFFPCPGLNRLPQRRSWCFRCAADERCRSLGEAPLHAALACHLVMVARQESKATCDIGPPGIAREIALVLCSGLAAVADSFAGYCGRYGLPRCSVVGRFCVKMMPYA